MKNFGKAVALLLVLFGVGAGGYFLGANSGATVQTAGQPQAAKASEETREQRIDRRVQEFYGVMHRDFLYDVDDDKVEADLYKGMFAGLGDPYSTYFTGEEFKRLMEDSSGEFAGVGIVITAGKDNLITVVSPIKGTPGEKAGIRTGDKIVAIDGKEYTAAEQDQAVNVMRGKVGDEVTLTIQREENGKPTRFDVKIKREIIHVDSVVSRMLDKEVGYVQITSFDEPTAQEFKTQVEQLQKDGAKAIVLDLRNNPGGLLSSCDAIADYLLGECTIVTTVDKNGHEQVTKSDAKENKIPLVLLVNGGSASASEILTGALRDNKRAIAIGTKTFGKGIVQRVYPLGTKLEDGGYKLTIAEYLTPSGAHIHGKGITPDIIVELPKDTEKIGPDALSQDTQLQRAITEVRKEAGLPAAAPAESSSEAENVQNENAPTNYEEPAAPEGQNEESTYEEPNNGEESGNAESSSEQQPGSEQSVPEGESTPSESESQSVNP